MASEKEIIKLSNELLDTSSTLGSIVGKRGLDELFGEDYDVYKKSINQIKKDIMKLGRFSNKKKSSGKKTAKSATGGRVRAMSFGGRAAIKGTEFKGTF